MRRLSARPLRVKITILVIALLSAGLAASSVIATAALRGYLVDRVDDVLRAGAQPFANIASLPPIAPDASAPRPPSLFYIAAVASDGSVTKVLSTPAAGAADVPALPTAADLAGIASTPVTVGSADGSTEWRLLVTSARGGADWVVSAYPLTEVQQTVGRLVLLQVIVGSVVVLLGGAVGYVVVRRSLRPLDGITAVAGTIADGDLSQRAPETGDDSEVDHLARSFNRMVTRIEESFAARRASERQARESEQRMRRFVADASHELRTPLTSIRGYAELIADGAAADDGVALARIQEEAARMGVLVDDLLVLARLDQQRPMARQSVDAGELVAAAVEAARAAAPMRSVSLVRSGEAAVVSGDAERLRQAFDNLLSNALRYSPDDAPVVATVSVGPDICTVAVADQGSGLTPEESARVFERLYRTDTARSRVRGGTGLGLAIVKSVVEAHGGSVAVDSQPGIGSTFTVTLPRIRG